MSVRYGLNGNDINWGFVDGHNEVCLNCQVIEREFRQTHPGWALYHDTNGNFCSVAGGFPLAGYESEYLRELLERLA